MSNFSGLAWSALGFAPTATMNPWTPHTRVPITRQLNGHAAGMAAQVRNNAGLCERWSYADHDGLAYRRGPLSPIISSAAALGRSLTGGIKDAIDLTIARLQSASEEGGGGGGKTIFWHKKQTHPARPVCLNKINLFF
ncbi:hypothetical protein SCARD494_09626 [Seiridium cardinale]